jgi:hypothetical protein
VGTEGAGGRWRWHTNYSSHCASCEVLPAIQLDLRLRERILDSRHLVCWGLNSFSVEIRKLLSQSETALNSARYEGPRLQGNQLACRIEGRGAKRRGEQTLQEQESKSSRGLFKVVDRWCCVPFLPSLIRASVDSELPCCPAASTVTSLAGCGLGCGHQRLIGLLTVHCAYLLVALSLVNCIRSEDDAWEG